jgi:hypothetical protein
MWIICCGLPRSGSTLQYNIIADIVEYGNQGKRIGFIENENFHTIIKENVAYPKYKIIKTHLLTSTMKEYLQNKKAILFSCYRDIRDVAVSYNSVWNKSLNNFIIDGNLDYYLNTYYEIKSYHPIQFNSYQELNCNLIDEISKIATLLNISLTQNQIDEIYKNNTLELRKNRLNTTDLVQLNGYKYNSHTLLHHNHITNGNSNQWKVKLSYWAIFKIELLSNFWLKENGFQIRFQFLDSISYFIFKSTFIKKALRKLLKNL